MARKLKLTRPELKRQRDALKRFKRYLPMLKLRQSQLQMQFNRVRREHAEARERADAAAERCARVEPLLADYPGVDVRGLAEPTAVRTHEEDIAGIAVPVLDRVEFAPPRYGLRGTSVWVDGALRRLRERAETEARVEVLERQLRQVERELQKTIQRVNLFEQVKIPEAQENIRRIRIKLGDEMTNAIGRSKIAKGKLEALTGPGGGDAS